MRSPAPSAAGTSGRPAPTAAGSSPPARRVQARGRRRHRAPRIAEHRRHDGRVRHDRLDPEPAHEVGQRRGVGPHRRHPLAARRASTRSAASAAPTDAGASPVSKMNDRAVFSSRSMTSGAASTAPPCAPSDFDSTTVRTMSGSPASPAASTAPRPAGPITPSACASSTTSRAPCARATACSCGQRGEIAVHGEHRVGDDQATCGVGGGQRGVHLVDVAVRDHGHRRAGQPAAVDERGVVAARRTPPRRPGRRARSARPRWRGSRTRTPARPGRRRTPPARLRARRAARSCR